ncbi:MAG: FAD-dependent oxidoreductase [Polyangiales bacterium]
MLHNASVDLVVLGGGPAGMAAAWEASLLGKSVWIIEREPTLGGLCSTIERDGFRFDLGGHRIVSKRAALVDRVRALMGDELEERSRKSVVLLRGQRFSYPLVARELATKLPPTVLARAVRDYAIERFISDSSDEITFRQWVTRRFGRSLYDLFFGPYTEKLWGMSADELSSDWASQRISLLNLSDVALRLTGLRRGNARTYARRYLYPRGGIGALFHSLARALDGLSVRTLTAARAAQFERDPDNGRVRAVVIERNTERWRLECGAVISTIPLAQCAKLVAPDNTELDAHDAALTHRGLRFLNIMLDRPEPVLDATWMYIADPSLFMTRLQEPAERSPSMTPRGCASLMVEAPCDAGTHEFNEPDDSLLERALTALDRAGIPLRRRVRGAFSSFAPYAYPTYRVGYRRRRDALLAALDRAPNVWTAGRQGLFRYVFMDTAMEMGFAAAREFAAGSKSDWRAIERIDNNPTLHEVQSVLG